MVLPTERRHFTDPSLRSQGLTRLAAQREAVRSDRIFLEQHGPLIYWLHLGPA
jgi:hypothetical protein